MSAQASRGASGRDVLGSFERLDMRWDHNFSTSIRVYAEGQTAVFAQRWDAGVANTSSLFGPPPPAGRCGAVSEHTDQAGGHEFAVLRNVSQAQCCDACLANTSCAAWVLTPPSEGSHCFLCASVTGAKPAPNRTAGFVRLPPPTANDADSVLAAFPSFGALPPSAAQPEVNFISWAGCQTASSYCGQWSGPPSPHRPFSANSRAGVPVLLFDRSLRSAMISPLGNFWLGIHSTSRVVPELEGGMSFDAGLKRSLQSIPPGFEHETILVAGQGVNATLYEWGELMLRKGGKTRVDPYNDFALSYVGFWTDNGAYYYHHHDNYSTAEAALKDVLRQAEAQHVPLRYMQWDDWWFNQSGNDSGGLVSWQPPESVFPDGLTRWLGLPLSLYVAMYSKHNSWIDRAEYDWKIDPLNREGGNALPLGQQFYTDLFRNGTDAGSAIDDTFVLSLVVVVLVGTALVDAEERCGAVVMFEQDFICTLNTRTHLTNTDVHTGRRWLEVMNAAALAANISLQFCAFSPLS